MTRMSRWCAVAMLVVTAGASSVLAAGRRPASREVLEAREEALRAKAQEVATEDFTVSQAEAAQAKLEWQEARREAQLARQLELNAPQERLTQNQRTVPPTGEEGRGAK